MGSVPLNILISKFDRDTEMTKNQYAVAMESYAAEQAVVA